MKRMFILVCALALAAGSGCSPRVEKKEVALAGAQSGGRLPERVRQFDGGEGFYLSGLKAERSDGKVSLQFGMRDLGQAPKAYEVVAVLVLPELTIYNYFGAGTHLLIFFPPASGGNNAAFSLDGFKRSGGAVEASFQLHSPMLFDAGDAKGQLYVFCMDKDKQRKPVRDKGFAAVSNVLQTDV